MTICSHKQIGVEMSVEGGDGGETSNVSRQGDSMPVELP